MMASMSEADRIRQEYADRYGDAGWSSAWHPRNLGGVYFRQQIERAVVSVLNEAGVELADAELLDVGCGTAPHLRYFVELGADRDRLHGVDLVPERIEVARQLTPAMDLRVADATDLPYDDGAFDVVSQFTALCNIRDSALLERAAAEMSRVLKPDGAIVWVDIARANGRDAPYQPISEPRVQELFSAFEIVAARRLFHRWSMPLAGRWPEVALALERLPIGKSHLVASLRRPGRER
jgi:ubiquinone/menaquinone biosynthesis C-methylase UbiE